MVVSGSNEYSFMWELYYNLFATIKALIILLLNPERELKCHERMNEKNLMVFSVEKILHFITYFKTINIYFC